MSFCGDFWMLALDVCTEIYYWLFGIGTQDAVDKKALEDRIILLSRSALKPHYHGGRITAQEYKTIMKKAITKVH